MFIFLLLAYVTQHDIFPSLPVAANCILSSFLVTAEGFIVCVYIYTYMSHLHNPFICDFEPRFIPYLSYMLNAAINNGVCVCVYMFI